MTDTLTDVLTAALVRGLIGCHRVLDPLDTGDGRVHALNGRMVPVRSHRSTDPWAVLELDTVAICADPMLDVHPKTRHGYAEFLPFKNGEFDAICTSPVSPPWGPAAKAHHERVWVQSVRVLRPGGRFVLHVPDHVADWHIQRLEGLGLQKLRRTYIGGEESVIAFIKPTPQTPIGVIQDSDVR